MEKIIIESPSKSIITILNKKDMSISDLAKLNGKSRQLIWHYLKHGNGIKAEAFVSLLNSLGYKLIAIQEEE